MTTHVKPWLVLLRRYFEGSELLVGLLCSFHLASVLRLASPMQCEPQKQSLLKIMLLQL